MGDAGVERAPEDRPLGLDGPVITEVLPQRKGNLGQPDPSAPQRR